MKSNHAALVETLALDTLNHAWYRVNPEPWWNSTYKVRHGYKHSAQWDERRAQQGQLAQFLGNDVRRRITQP